MQLDPVVFTRYWASRAIGRPALASWQHASPRRAPPVPVEPALPSIKAHGRAMADYESKSAAPVAHVLPALRDAKVLPKAASKKASYALYVATLPDGSKRIQKFYVPDGRKPDPNYGYNVTVLLSRAVPVSGYVEHNGARINDPVFDGSAPVERKASAAARLKAICKALNEGEIDAAILLANKESDQ